MGDAEKKRIIAIFLVTALSLYSLKQYEPLFFGVETQIYAVRDTRGASTGFVAPFASIPPPAPRLTRLGNPPPSPFALFAYPPLLFPLLLPYPLNSFRPLPPPKLPRPLPPSFL